MNLVAFIKQRPHLFWYISHPERLSREAVVEAVLNYGDWDDVQTLIKLVGIKTMAKIFRAKSPKSPIGRTNYFPEIIHYFNVFFNKYAPR